MRSAKICYGWLLSILFFVLLSPPPLSSQPASDITCVGATQVSVDASCQYVIDPKTLLRGDSIPDQLNVFVFDSNPSNREVVECPGTYNYSITNERNVIICWGLITLVDDQAPIAVDTITRFDTLECAQIDKILNNPTTVQPFVDGQANPYYLGEVRFEENCTSCNCDLTVKFFDQVDFYPCDSLPYFARITRRWTATDCENNLKQVEQYFHLVRPPFETLNTIPDQEIATCSPQEVVIEDQYPFWIDTFGDTLFLDEVDCNLDIQLVDELLSSCDDQFNQLQRKVQVYDWCTGDTSIVDQYQITYGDLEAPIFSQKAINLSAANTLSILNNEYDRTTLNQLGQQGLVTELSTGPMGCGISFPLEAAFLEERFGYVVQDCSKSNYRFSFYSFGGSPREKWSYSTFNSSASIAGIEVQNIPPGLHAMIIEVSDECGNTGKGLVPFTVRDRIAPVAKCADDTKLSIILQEEGIKYQRLEVADIDQNSTDNCQLGKKEIRRAVPDLEIRLNDFIALGYDTDQNGVINQADYFDQNQNGQQDKNENNWSYESGQWFSPWAERTDFFCVDVNTAVQVQARFFDQAIEPLSGVPSPNQGQCWVEVSINDTSTFSLEPLPNLQLDCSHPVLATLTAGTYTLPEDSSVINTLRKELGYPNIIGNICGTLAVQETINTALDNCGFGEITRTVSVEKPGPNGPITTSTTQQITVRERYDYWIKFPKDIQANCSAGIVDTGFLEVAEEYCDLLAITYTDNYLYAPQDTDACFKIFRTYQVINWCEYDGRSAPVIVSRDWDNWNGVDCGTQYNVNPSRPDGNNQPGDNDLYVIVRRNFNDELPDTVYYDADNNPNNNFPDNPNTEHHREGYWWKIISGLGTPDDPSYYETAIDCDTGKKLDNVWGRNSTGDFSSAVEETNTAPRFGSFGYWQYTQHLLVYDDIYPEVEVSGSSFICGEMREDCLVEVQLGMHISDQCIGSNNLELEIWFDENRDGESLIDYSTALEDTLFTAAFPLGNHRLILWADDNCGNRVRQNFNLTITDCTAPQPLCKPGLVIDLIADKNGGALANAMAVDFIDSPLFDCAGQGPEEDANGRLRINDFSINPKGAPFNRSQSSLSLSCSQLTDPTFIVEIHAWDDKGQHGFCESIISLKDPQNICPLSTGMIAGTIVTEDNRFIQNADVNLSGPLPMLYLSDENGKYAFEQIETNTDYTVSPSLNSGFLNGISTRDILLIQNHILGRQKLNSPYKLIAADINNSKAISTLDLIELRKLILSIDLRFANNSSWRFVPANYRFSNPENPWQSSFPEIINVNDLQDSLMSADFIGIKIGDVSGNVDPASTLSLEERSMARQGLYYTDELLQPNQEYEIPIRAALPSLQGMQFTLNIDPGKATITGIVPAAFAEHHYRLRAERGWLATSWLQSEANSRAIEEEICFKLVLKPKSTVHISELLSLQDHWVRSEAYEGDLVKRLELRTNASKSGESDFSFEKAYPNPFHEDCQIHFHNPQAQEISIRVFDLSGRLVWQKINFLNVGSQQVALSGSQLPGKGVYLIKISSPQSEQTQRIIYH